MSWATAGVSWPTGPRCQLSPEVTAGVLASRPSAGDPRRHSNTEILIHSFYTDSVHTYVPHIVLKAGGVGGFRGFPLGTRGLEGQGLREARRPDVRAHLRAAALSISQPLSGPQFFHLVNGLH